MSWSAGLAAATGAWHRIPEHIGPQLSPRDLAIGGTLNAPAQTGGHRTLAANPLVNKLRRYANLFGESRLTAADLYRFLHRVHLPK